MFCCLYYYFLDYSVLYVCIYGVHGGMHDTELLGENIFGGPGQSSDVEPGEHDEQGQGRTAFHQFMQILGKVCLCGPHRPGWCRSSLFFFFFSSAFVMKWD